MIIFQVRINVSPAPMGFGFTARGFIDALHCMLAKTCGGSCVGVVDGAVVTFEARSPEKEPLTSLVDSYCGTLRKDGRNVEIVVVENPATPLGQSALASGAMLNSAPTKLTKAFFMKLPSGTFVASNCMKQGFVPVFAESVGDGADVRVAQWKRLRAVNADQRMCHTFPTEGHYRHWWQQQIEYFTSLKH